MQAKVDANAAAADARAAEAAATTDAERRAAAAESRKRSAELKQSQAAIRKRRTKRHQRDGTAPPRAKPRAAKPKAAAGPTTRGGRAEAELPKDLGATATGRNSAFARDGRNADAARQAAERQVRNALAPLRKHLEKGRKLQAAAMLGGLARAPSIRPLLQAAGLVLSEDVDLDAGIVDRIAAVVGPAGSKLGRQD